MPSRRGLCLLSTIVLLLIALPASASATGRLYLEQADSGSLRASRLVLRNVAPRVTTFTDRPRRQAGSQRVAAFVRSWPRAFGDDPPNAALQIEGASAWRDMVVVELRRPRYDRARRTLSFRVRRLKRAGGALRAMDRRADRGVHGGFGRATLFVDDGSSLVTNEVTLTMSAPPGTTTSLNLSNGTIASSGQLRVQSLDPFIPLSSLSLNANNLTFTTVSGASALAAWSVNTWIAASSTTLNGSASIPAGGSIGLSFYGGGGAIPNGSFSVPFS